MELKEKRKSSQSRTKKKGFNQEDVKTRVDSCLLTMRGLRDLAEREANLVTSALKDMEDNLIDPRYILELTKSIHGTGSKNVADYIKRNTEILLNEHAIVVRQKVIQSMKKQIEDMKKEMSHDSKKLADDIANFFQFIQSSYEQASQSFKKVIDIAKINYEKSELINETQEKLFSLKSELQNLEQQLLKCLMCSEFLTILTPEDSISEKQIIPKSFLKSFGPSFSAEERMKEQKEVLKTLLMNHQDIKPVDVKSISPEEVMKAIERLKASNLSLVQNSQVESVSSFPEMSELVAAQQEMDEELDRWNTKIAEKEEELKKVKKINSELTKKLKDIEQDESKKNQGQRGQELKKLTEIYQSCTGSEAKVTDLDLMRRAIDHAIEQLLSELNAQPKRKVKEIIKILEAEKKQSERKTEEKLRQQRANEKLKKGSTAKTRARNR